MGGAVSSGGGEGGGGDGRLGEAGSSIGGGGGGGAGGGGGGGVGGRACAGEDREAAPVPVLLMRGGAGFTPDDTGTGAVVGPAAAVFDTSVFGTDVDSGADWIVTTADEA